MKIIEKIKARAIDSHAAKSPTIVFLGDSVTQGCFECYTTGEYTLTTEFDETSGYVNRVRELLRFLYPTATVNVVNAGINGDNTAGALKRLERDVLSQNPDMVVVSLGLNDSVQGMDGLETYGNNLAEIFKAVKENGAEIIFLTQNYMNTQTSYHLKDQLFIKLADEFGQIQKDGTLDKYFERAKAECAKQGVRVCDVRKAWELMDKGGVNITELLSNKLNHPVRPFHYYMAIKILETMFD